MGEDMVLESCGGKEDLRVWELEVFPIGVGINQDVCRQYRVFWPNMSTGTYHIA